MTNSLTLEFSDITTEDSKTVRELLATTPLSYMARFVTRDRFGNDVSGERWFKPPTEVKVETGKHAADGEVSFEEHAAKKRAADAAKKLLEDADTAFTAKRWLTGDPMPTVDEAVSEGIQSVGDLSEAVKEAAVKQIEETLEYMGTLFGIDFDLEPGAIKKIIGESGISDAAAAFIAATGDPFQPYKDVASEDRRKAYKEFVAKRKAKAAAAAVEPAADPAALAHTALERLKNVFKARVDALSPYPFTDSASADRVLVAEAQTALDAVVRELESLPPLQPALDGDEQDAA
ncbi:hypothetical protein [Rhodococcoides fascians]|uniref:hypothetical protein n=1 Tax=Rhodococcoides fascians TaxID=1828 RepID=UPI000AB7A55A|nr:hypothetical protein [Rhodococcus fascians]